MGRLGQTLEAGERPAAFEPAALLAKALDPPSAADRRQGFIAASVRGARGTMGQSAMPTPRPPLILASTSRYRRELLERLRLPFEWFRPPSTRRPLPGEAPRHWRARAWPRPRRRRWRRCAPGHGDRLRPGRRTSTAWRSASPARTSARWRNCARCAVAAWSFRPPWRGQQRRQRALPSAALAPVKVRFRDLRDDEIEHYLRTEQPYDCAGSAKQRDAGHQALLEAIESDDPTAWSACR